MKRTDTGPFAMVPVWVLDAPVSDRAVRLYAAMRRYADKDNGECWPARKTIAQRLRCSVDSVDRAMSELTDLGAIVVAPRQDGKANLPNLYSVIAAPRPPMGTDAVRGMGNAAAQNYRHVELEKSLSDPAAPEPPPIADFQANLTQLRELREAK